MTDEAAEPRPEGAGSTMPPPASSDEAGAGFTSRYGLVRPRQGRYVAGVCAAIGRATNTDPVLWRVLIAVLGFFGGIGILFYLAGWLIIPAEGDTASPVESMLGRGRSSMSPVTVIVLGVLAVVMFGLIVTDGFRAVVLGAAALVGGALILNRKRGTAAPDGGFGAGRPWQAPGQPYPPAADPYQASAAYPPTAEWPAAGAGPASGDPTAPPTGAGDQAAEPPTAAFPAQPGTDAQEAPTTPIPPPYAPPVEPPLGQPAPAGPGPVPPFTPPYPPPSGGYRPPFAPHGPYAGQGPYPPSYAGPPPRPPKPPKPPKERSPLGAATFSMIFVALGLIAALDLANLVSVAPSTYFAAVLVTIALGLLVGAWFGRARWLIALGFIAAAALGISTIAESQVGRYPSSSSEAFWQPTSIRAVADRYEHNLGGAVLDLSKVDFTGQDQTIDVHVSWGDLEVIVPPNVDATVQAEVNAGDADIFGNTSSGIQVRPGAVVDHGSDGEGGGKLNLVIKVNAGKAEVRRS